MPQGCLLLGEGKASPWAWNRRLPMTIYRSHETFSECARKAHHSCSVCVKDNTLKPEPFHREGVCWHVKPLQELFLLTGHFCKGPPYDLLTMWPFGPSFPFILAFWAFISFHFWLVWAATWGPPQKLPKTVRVLMKFKKILSAPKPAAFWNFWPSRPSFLFILAFWAFISFHFEFLALNLLSFWPFGLSFPFILVFWAFENGHPARSSPKLQFSL